MAEASQIKFSFQEVAEALIKLHNIHAGHWCIMVQFGLRATNMTVEPDVYSPTAIIPVMALGIQESDKPNPLSVDASVVNPEKKSRSKKKTKKGENKSK